jgi:hypothetical protein
MCVKKINLPGWAGLLLILPVLACANAKPTRPPTAIINQLNFDVQTATPTFTPILTLADAPTYTPDPNATPTLTATVATAATLTKTLTATVEPTASPAEAPAAEAPQPPSSPTPAPTPVLSEPLQSGAWDFEEGFDPWRNPHGDTCPVGALGKGWSAFTTRDKYGSACMNRTDWAGNVFSGHNAQEITFAYVGIEAGIFKTAPAIAGHRYTIEAHMRREFSPAKVAMALGVDLTGGADWQATSIQWFPWNEDIDDAWGKTSVTITATGDKMTIFLKGTHPYPEPGGVLRLDAISIIDIGPEGQ